jgi:hypothetical protein
MDKLNILTRERVRVAGKKLFKDKPVEIRRNNMNDQMDEVNMFRPSFKGNNEQVGACEENLTKKKKDMHKKKNKAEFNR